MKKVYLVFLGLCCVAQVSVFGQLYLRVETAPTLFLPHKPFNRSAANYVNLHTGLEVTMLLVSTLVWTTP